MKLAFFATVLIAAGLSPASAYSANAKPNLKKAQIKERLFSSAPLDIAAEFLPPNYLGHDCRVFAKRLVGLNTLKGEFETTADYNDRIAPLADQPASASTKFGDIVGFVEERPSFYEKYDADTQTYNIRGGWGVVTQMIGSRLVSSVEIDSKLISTRKYTGENSYGRKTEVTAYRLNVCGLAFSNLGYLSPKKIDFYENLEINPGEAKEAKGNIGVLYVGRLSAPFRTDYSHYIKPTFTSPVEITSSGDALTMTLSAVWLFNKRTGRIYRKLEI